MIAFGLGKPQNKKQQAADRRAQKTKLKDRS
jgi:hypothetical protein